MLANEWFADRQHIAWWTRQTDRDFAELKARLPGRLDHESGNGAYFRNNQDWDRAGLAAAAARVTKAG